MSSSMDLNDALKDAPDFEIEVLTSTELDLVAGGGDFYVDSNTTSICSTDGSDEPGTS